MKLPAADRAIVDEAKVRDYLLSPEHPIGRYKARVFRSVGYDPAHWQQLRDDLRVLAATIDVAPSAPDVYGQRYVGQGTLLGPSGRTLPIVTVWLIPSTEAAPRLVTAYPGGET